MACVCGPGGGFTVRTSGVCIVWGAFRAWATDFVVEVIASLSFLTNCQAVSRGVIDLREVIFFVSMILVTLFINTAIIDLKKSG